MPPLPWSPFVILVCLCEGGGNVGHVYIPQDGAVDGGAIIVFLCQQVHTVNALLCLPVEEYPEKQSLISSCLAHLSDLPPNVVPSEDHFRSLQH